MGNEDNDGYKTLLASAGWRHWSPPWHLNLCVHSSDNELNACEKRLSEWTAGTCFQPNLKMQFLPPSCHGLSENPMAEIYISTCWVIHYNMLGWWKPIKTSCSATSTIKRWWWQQLYIQIWLKPCSGRHVVGHAFLNGCDSCWSDHAVLFHLLNAVMLIVVVSFGSSLAFPFSLF